MGREVVASRRSDTSNKTISSTGLRLRAAKVLEKH